MGTGPAPWRAALLPEELAIVLLVGDKEVARLPLAGQTRDEAFAWLVTKAKDLGAPAGKLSLATPYSLPDHALGHGGAFALMPDASYAELGVGSRTGTACCERRPRDLPVPRRCACGRTTSTWARCCLSVGPRGRRAEPRHRPVSRRRRGRRAVLLHHHLAGSRRVARAAGRRALAPRGLDGRGSSTGTEVVAAGDGAAQAATVLAFLTGTIDVLAGFACPLSDVVKTE
jgi:hypothetical protein